MPKVNWKKKLSGVLGRKPHKYHRHWQFSYSEEHDTGFHAVLHNDDLEECSHRNWIKIVRASVLLYIGEQDTSVTADLHLPVQVKMVVIKKYGKDVPFCFATVGGCENCSVFPGAELKKNPHANR